MKRTCGFVVSILCFVVTERSCNKQWKRKKMPHPYTQHQHNLPVKNHFGLGPEQCLTGSLGFIHL